MNAEVAEYYHGFEDGRRELIARMQRCAQVACQTIGELERQLIEEHAARLNAERIAKAYAKRMELNARALRMKEREIAQLRGILGRAERRKAVNNAAIDNSNVVATNVAVATNADLI